MRSIAIRWVIFTAMLGMVLVIARTATAQSVASVSAEEAREIAVDTYIYAYPMVISELTRRTAFRDPNGAMNRISHRRAFPDANFTDVVRPNADTLYSILWFDVSSEPLVLSVPDSGGRYYLLQFMDLWSDTFASPGSRTTGNKAQTIVLADANWKGQLPSGAMLIRSPTAVGWMIGRTQTNGAADYSNVHKFQDGMQLSTLSKQPIAQKATIDPTWDVKTPPVVQVEKMSAQDYFVLFASLTQKNAPHANDYPILHRMARIGIEPGKSFAYTAAPAEVRKALDAAATPALKLIKGGLGSIGVRQNGWRISMTAVGTYGTDYRSRAAIAFGGLGANPIEDAMYPSAFADGDGKPFVSDNRYVLHFTKSEIPPVRGFWSLTMYDERQLFTANALNRYAIGDRDKLKFNADGSLDLYIQRASPGQDKESNWLPAPSKGAFTMNLRLYWPHAEALHGTWLPPPVKREP